MEEETVEIEDEYINGVLTHRFVKGIEVFVPDISSESPKKLDCVCGKEEKCNFEVDLITYMDNRDWREEFLNKFSRNIPNHSFGWSEQDGDGLRQVMVFISNLLQKQQLPIREKVILEIQKVIIQRMKEIANTRLSERPDSFAELAEINTKISNFNK